MRNSVGRVYFILPFLGEGWEELEGVSACCRLDGVCLSCKLQLISVEVAFVYCGTEGTGLGHDSCL